MGVAWQLGAGRVDVGHTMGNKLPKLSTGRSGPTFVGDVNLRETSDTLADKRKGRKKGGRVVSWVGKDRQDSGSQVRWPAAHVRGTGRFVRVVVHPSARGMCARWRRWGGRVAPLRVVRDAWCLAGCVPPCAALCPP